MLYHNNRLIKPFERVGYQRQPNEKGIGVIGVAEVRIFLRTDEMQFKLIRTNF